MKLLTSNKFKLPTIWFISDMNERNKLHVGTSYIFGHPDDEKHIIRLLEYNVLYRAALKTKLPFDFKKILKENGYNTREIQWFSPAYIDYVSDEDYEDFQFEEKHLVAEDSELFKKHVEDCCAFIDLNTLMELKIIPTFCEIYINAIKTNIHNYALYNPHLYNKKLDGMYGFVDIMPVKRNLIIVDISQSMTKSISTATLLLAKTFGTSFNADILITGKISVLYEYEMIHTLDVEKIYAEVGMANEGDYFRKLLEVPREYGTAIVFGDNNHPGEFASSFISDEDGKKLCKWSVNKVISFHKDSDIQLAGYARWFNVPKENIEYISNWVKYFN